MDAGLDQDREAALALRPVSRETVERLDVFAGELTRWQTVKNLVGRGTLDQIWTRHIADSLQLLDLADGQRWADLGSGAGFPGLVLGIAALDERPGMHVDLIESNARKCAFLRHIARQTGAAVTIHHARLEDILGGLPETNVVTARALAPLTTLIGWSEQLLKTGAVGLFPKGRDAAAELTEACKSWKFDADVVPSLTDSDARIVRIRSLHGQSSQ